MRYSIIWGGEKFPMFSTGLTRDEAQEMIDDLDARGITYTVAEAEHVQA